MVLQKVQRQKIIRSHHPATSTHWFFPPCLLFFFLCLLISFPTQFGISHRSESLPVSCVYASIPSRSPGSTWKNIGLRSCWISRVLNALFQRCIHLSPDPSSTSVEEDGEDEDSVKDGTEEVEFVESRRPRSSQRHCFSLSHFIARNPPILLCRAWARLIFPLCFLIQWYRWCSSSVKTADGVSSLNRAATARPQGPAPMIITSRISFSSGRGCEEVILGKVLSNISALL